MLSSLSSLVWGEVGVREEEPGPPTTTIHERDHSLEDDWVVVGRVAQFPGTLSNNFSLPESDTPMHVSPVRSQVGDVDQDLVQKDVNPTKITREKSAAPKCMAKMLRRTQEKKLKSSQLTKQKEVGKYFGRKNLRRSNLVAGRSEKSGRKSKQMRMAGAYRNIKQC